MRNKIRVYNGDKFIKTYESTHQPKIGNNLKFNNQWYIVTWLDKNRDHIELNVEIEKTQLV